MLDTLPTHSYIVLNKNHWWNWQPSNSNFPFCPLIILLVRECCWMCYSLDFEYSDLSHSSSASAIPPSAIVRRHDDDGLPFPRIKVNTHTHTRRAYSMCTILNAQRSHAMQKKCGMDFKRIVSVEKRKYLVKTDHWWITFLSSFAPINLLNIATYSIPLILIL